MVELVGTPADGLNAAIYKFEGKDFEAKMSAAAMLPGGIAATAAKYGKGLKLGDKLVDEAKILTKNADEVAEGAVKAEKALDGAEGTSKLDEVFSIAKKYNLDDTTYADHILKRHGAGSTGYSFKSKLSSDFNVLGGIDEVLTGSNSIVKPNTGDRAGYIFEQTYDAVIGYDKKGKALHTLKVVIDEAGNVITAFPKK